MTRENVHNNKHFHEKKIINFNFIHRQCRGEVVLPDPLKYYQTIKESTVSGYPSSEKTEICSSAYGTDRKDIFLITRRLKNILKK